MKQEFLAWLARIPADAWIRRELARAWQRYNNVTFIDLDYIAAGL